MQTFLEFEKPIAELEGKIEELRHLTDTGDINIADEVSKLQVKVDRLLRQTYAKLAPAQKVQVARHPNRPHCIDTSKGWLRISHRWPATGALPRTAPSSAASGGSGADPP